MKRTISFLLCLLAFLPLSAQKYMTRTAKVSFFSATSMENIEGINNESSCILDGKSGVLQFFVPINSFKFEKALMQEHFNENYMESDKFPKAEFKGNVLNMGSINMTKDGSHEVQVMGKLTIHGVTREVAIPGTLTIKSGVPVAADASFSVKCADYGVRIPSVVASKIAESIKVTIHAPLSADRL